MAGDWIKLHRKTLESQVFSDADLFRLWAYLLMRANYKPSFFRGHVVGVGQVAFSQRVVCELLHVSRGKLQRDLKRLSDMGNLKLESSQDFTVVTICNWQTYQTADDPDGATSGATDEATGRATDRATNGTIPKKERSKRRKEGEEISSSSEPAEPASEQVVMVFPTVGRLAKTWDLLPSFVATLAESFPAVDVLAECKKARGWCESNASKRKTPSGMPKFLFGWMERNQNRGGSAVAGGRGNDPRGTIAAMQRYLNGAEDASEES